MLIVGGGYIGMELGTVYSGLGSQVVVVEALDSILIGADPDLVRPVMARARKTFSEVRLKNTISRPLSARPKVSGGVMTGRQMLDDSLPYALGQRVNHAMFGEGTVVQFEGQGNGLRVQVNFDDAGSKWLVVSFAKLEAL